MFRRVKQIIYYWIQSAFITVEIYIKHKSFFYYFQRTLLQREKHFLIIFHFYIYSFKNPLALERVFFLTIFQAYFIIQTKPLTWERVFSLLEAHITFTVTQKGVPYGDHHWHSFVWMADICILLRKPSTLPYIWNEIYKMSSGVHSLLWQNLIILKLTDISIFQTESITFHLVCLCWCSRADLSCSSRKFIVGTDTREQF